MRTHTVWSQPDFAPSSDLLRWYPLANIHHFKCKAHHLNTKLIILNSEYSSFQIPANRASARPTARSTSVTPNDTTPSLPTAVPPILHCKSVNNDISSQSIMVFRTSLGPRVVLHVVIVRCFNAKILVFNTIFLVFNTKFLVFNANFLVFNTKILVFLNAKFLVS